MKIFILVGVSITMSYMYTQTEAIIALEVARFWLWKSVRFAEAPQQMLIKLLIKTELILKAESFSFLRVILIRIVALPHINKITSSKK